MKKNMFGHLVLVGVVLAAGAFAVAAQPGSMMNQHLGEIEKSYDAKLDETTVKTSLGLRADTVLDALISFSCHHKGKEVPQGFAPQQYLSVIYVAMKNGVRHPAGPVTVRAGTQELGVLTPVNDYSGYREVEGNLVLLSLGLLINASDLDKIASQPQDVTFTLGGRTFTLEAASIKKLANLKTALAPK